MRDAARVRIVVQPRRSFRAFSPCSTAKRDSKRISWTTVLIPLCGIVASFRAGKVFPDSLAVFRLLFTGLSTVAEGWGRVERGSLGFVVDAGPDSVFPSAIVRHEILGRIPRKIDGTKTGPATPPLRVPLFKSAFATGTRLSRAAKPRRHAASSRTNDFESQERILGPTCLEDRSLGPFSPRIRGIRTGFPDLSLTSAGYSFCMRKDGLLSPHGWK